MPQFERITLIIESLPGARAQVQVNIPTPTPGMRLETPAHALAIDALGWLGKQPAVAGFVYGGAAPAAPQITANARLLHLLRWSAEDLADPSIRADAERFEQERKTAINRLSPHIEELVALAWAQLHAGNSSESSKEAP